MTWLFVSEENQDRTKILLLWTGERKLQNVEITRIPGSLLRPSVGWTLWGWKRGRRGSRLAQTVKR